MIKLFCKHKFELHGDYSTKISNVDGDISTKVTENIFLPNLAICIKCKKKYEISDIPQFKLKQHIQEKFNSVEFEWLDES